MRKRRVEYINYIGRQISVYKKKLKNTLPSDVKTVLVVKLEDVHEKLLILS